MRFVLDQAYLTDLEILLSKDHKSIYYLDRYVSLSHVKYKLSIEEVRIIESLSLLVKE